jgi:hypothetical protein
LLITIGVTLALSLVVACLGWFMAPVSWQWVLLILGYNAVWFLVSDLVKVAVYHVVPARDIPAGQ